MLREHRFVALAVASGLLAAVTAYQFLSGVARQVQVVVAATAIPQFARIEPAMVTVTELPVVAVHPDAAVTPEEVVGRYLTAPSAAGEQLLRGQLAGGSNDPRLVARLTPDLRAMAVPLGPGSALGAALQPGDRVAVIFVADDRLAGVDLARTLLEGLLVLDVRADDGGPFVPGRSPGAPAAAILALPLADAERLAYALEHGVVYLALEGYGARPAPTGGATLESLFVPGPGGAGDPAGGVPPAVPAAESGP